MERREFLLSTSALLAGVATGVSLPAVVAEARVGNPASPGSVAGVRRRTRRRTRRRVVVGMTLLSLPSSGCSPVVRGSVTYQSCGGVLYQPVQQGAEVVYVVKEVPPGTEVYTEDYAD